MISNLYRMSDAEFSVWLENFNTVIEANKVELNVSNDQVLEMLGLQTGHNTALTEKQSADELKQSKTANLRQKRRDAMKKVAFYNKIFKADENIPTSLIELAGFDANDGIPTSSTPQQPINLVANGFSNGNNELKWNKNGNKPNTVYIIEGRLESEANFSFVGTTTKQKFAHKNQTPGARMFYRVKAQRHDQESTFSNTAVVY